MNQNSYWLYILHRILIKFSMIKPKILMKTMKVLFSNSVNN